MRVFLALLVAVNPPAVAAGLRGRTGAVMALAAGATFALAVALAGASSGILDALDVSRPTFRLAAGAVLAAGSLWWVVAGTRPAPVDRPGPGLALCLATLISPQLVAVSISLGADDGVGAVALGAAAVLALTWLASAFAAGTHPAAWSAAARIVGAFGVAVALDMVVDGVKTV